MITLLLHVLRLLVPCPAGRPPVERRDQSSGQKYGRGQSPVGAPRIHGELLKLGIVVAERTVSRLLPKRRSPPAQTWRTFLTNHVRDLVSVDFFTVPTARLRVLFVFVADAFPTTLPRPTSSATATRSTVTCSGSA